MLGNMKSNVYFYFLLIITIKTIKMEITISSPKDYKISSSVGIYYRDEKTQCVGYWKTKERNDKTDFIEVCVFPINSYFQTSLAEAAKKTIKELYS